METGRWQQASAACGGGHDGGGKSRQSVRGGDVARGPGGLAEQLRSQEYTLDAHGATRTDLECRNAPMKRFYLRETATTSDFDRN